MKSFLSLCIAAIAAVAICSAQDISPNVTVKDLSGNNVLMRCPDRSGQDGSAETR